MTAKINKESRGVLRCIESHFKTTAIICNA